MQNFNVDISSPGGPLVFYAMQADSLSRFFTLTITDNGAAWDPPSGALWSVRFGAPQMPSGWYDTIEDATQATHQAISVATGAQTVATVEIAEQALSSPGQNILCVLVTGSEGYQIASWPIILSIQPVPGLTAPQVTDYYNLLTGQVAQVLQNAQAAAQSAADAQEYAQQAQQVSQGAVGYYETAVALEAAHPTGEAGNWAIVGDSDTIYVWDTDTNAWVDTGSNIDLSQYYTKAQSDKKYALGTSGVADSAAKIQTPVNIGNASFDGSEDITLAEIGVGFTAAVITPGSGWGSSLSRVSASSVYVDVYINLIKGDNPVYYETICTLPENARPQVEFVCPAVLRNAQNGLTQSAVAQIISNGEVKLFSAAPEPSLGLKQIIIKTGFALR